MKKSVASFISLNRNLIVFLAVFLGGALMGVIAWQVSAMGDQQSGSRASSSEPLTATVSQPSGQVSASSDIIDPSLQPRGQEAPHGMYRGVSTAVRFDVSAPLRTLRGTPAHEEEDRDKFEDLTSNYAGPLGPQDVDKTVQTKVGGDSPNVMPTPIINFDSTIGCGGCAPPDPNGEVGPNHMVVMGNTQFQIFSKTGTSLMGPTNINALWSGFGGACQTENAGDPVVLYDQLDDRWILTQFTAAGPTWFNCVAVSTSPDPTGTYFRYAFTTGSNFPDYPKYGMWSDALYIATREFAGGSTFAGVGAYAINRAQLIAGNPAAAVVSFLASPASAGGAFNVGDGLLPTDLDGMQPPPAGSPEYYLGSMDNGGPYSAPSDNLTLWKFHADFATPANSSFTLASTIPIASYDTIPAFCGGTRACIPQQGTTNLLDHLGYRERPLFRAAYRNFGNHESIVTNQSVEASTTMSGIRWWEIRSPSSSPVLFQDATYAPGLTDNIHRWMGSVAMDTVGNMAMGYSASNSTMFPSVMYTGRLAGDPVNTMPQGEATMKAGTGSQTGGGNRWGDYTDLTVDPVDDCTFWYVNEYVPATSAAGWRLTIGSFKFPSCSLGPSFSMSVTPGSQDLCTPAPAVYTVNTTSISGFTTPITLSATGNPAGSTVTFAPNPVVPGSPSTMTVTTAGAAAGASTIHVTGVAGAITQSQDVTLKLTTQSPGPITLTAPANGTTSVDLHPTFTWTASTQAASYTIEIATDAAFTNIVHTASGLTTTTYSGAQLSSLTHYFWRVRGINTCGTGANSATFDFTTALICIVPFSNTAPIAINDNAAGSPYPSNIAVSGLTGTVTAVTVTLTGVSHTFPDDVDIMLVGPGGQNTLIISDTGGGGDITNLNFTFDDAAAANLPDATQIVGGTFKPTDFDTASDVFPAPAPAPGATVAMSVFNGTNPNGTWSLYVRDDLGIDSGTISGGWTVTITTSCTASTPSPTPTASPSNSPTATNTATATATSTPTPGPTCAANFANATPIAINDNAAGSPYPSNIAVSGLIGTVTKVTVDLTGMSHTFPDDVDIMLVGPGGQNTMIMSDVGGGGDITSLNFTFDDAAAASLPDATQIVGGTFKPSDFDTASDVFPAPAPPRGATVAMSVFNATDPNGTWSLYVRDDLGIDSGTISGGWALHIVTTTTSCVTPTASSDPTMSQSPTSTSTSTSTSTATPTAVGTPSIQFSSSAFMEDESQTAAITVNRIGSTTGTNTVNFSTSDGTATGGASCSTSGVDYISVTNQAVTFNPGDTFKTVNVQICSDTLTEPAQTVNLTLTGGNLGTPSAAVLTINDVASAYRSLTAICTTFGGPGSPYPSTISVSSAPANIGSMRVTLFDVAHQTSDSMDFLLVGPGGQKFILMADAGGLIDLTNPVTLTFSDSAGQVLPNSAPLTTGVFEPTSWEPGQASFPAPAPAAPYNEPGSTVGGTGTQTLVGNFGGTNANGTWSLFMRDDAGSLTQAVTGCVNGGWGLEFFGSTAANASISGRVLTSNGQGIRNAKVVITGNSLAQPIVATTGSFGYFTFEGLQTGETYVVTVFSKRYTFSAPSRVISLVDNVADADFIADPQD